MSDGHLPGSGSGMNQKALLAVAQELQRWVARLPIWSEASGEAWQTFSRPLGKHELELAETLGRLPGCTITRSTNGATTTLTLAGVEAKAQGGLGAACRSWVAKVQKGGTRPVTQIELSEGMLRMGPPAAICYSQLHGKLCEPR